MAELIDREATYKVLTAYYHHKTDIQHMALREALNKVPSADVQPVRRGKWYHGEAYPHHLYCSVCYRTALPNDEYVERWGLHMNYCPNCGARMDGEHDE